MFERKIVTVWSAPNYCYRCGNKACIMEMKEGGGEDFIYFKNALKRSSEQLNVELITDLNLSGILDYPLGLSDDLQNCYPFTGTFAGNGHTVENIFMDNRNHAEYSDASIFCSLKNATISNLTIKNSCKFYGYRASGLSMFAEENVIISAVRNEADIVGIKRGCGLVNKIQENATVLFLNDENVGSVKGDHTACGLFFQNPNSYSMVVSCVNKGTIQALNAFGISTMKIFSERCILATQVLNIGDVLSTIEENEYAQYNAFAFWPRDYELYSDELYAISKTCNPAGELSFNIHSKKGMYVDDSGKYVSDVLNDGQEPIWTKCLDIVGTGPEDPISDISGVSSNEPSSNEPSSNEPSSNEPSSNEFSINNGERTKVLSLLIILCAAFLR